MRGYTDTFESIQDFFKDRLADARVKFASLNTKIMQLQEDQAVVDTVDDLG
tara:strand:+ start:267 stop:419 length:153 start_codon:yes stop_codon:yes gene_type:complete